MPTIEIILKYFLFGGFFINSLSRLHFLIVETLTPFSFAIVDCGVIVLSNNDNINSLSSSVYFFI